MVVRKREKGREKEKGRGIVGVRECVFEIIRGRNSERERDESVCLRLIEGGTVRE